LQAKNAAALQDVEADVERLRVKAAAKARRRLACLCRSPQCHAPGVSCAARALHAQVREFLLQRFYGLRKPKTNIQARATATRRVCCTRDCCSGFGR
jgi:hypothetical protein